MRCTKLILACLMVALVLPSAAAALPPLGGLTQLPGTSGCVNYDGSSGCATEPTIGGVLEVAVSPDSRNVYMASLENSGSVSAFTRDSTTGAITGRVSCAAKLATAGCTTLGNKLDYAYGLDVSPDGKQVYVVGYSSQTIVTFNRDPSSGALTYASCNSSAVIIGCTLGTLGTLNGVQGVDVSPDGKSVYTVSGNGQALVRFNRDATTGALNEADCFNPAGTGGCGMAAGLANPWDVEVSSDNRNVYASDGSLDGVAVFNRNTDTGSIQPPAGSAACISSTNPGCTSGHDMTGVQRLSISPDGNNIYVAGHSSNTIAVLSRASNGTLSQAAGAAGAISLQRAGAVLVSPDGKNVYAGTGFNDSGVQDSIAIYDRSASGALSQMAPPNGCFNTTGASSCTVGRELNDVGSLAVPSQGNSLYAAAYSDGAIGVYVREIPPTCTNPATQTFRNDKGGDVPLPCSDPNGDPITSRSISTPPTHGAVTVNNTSGRASYVPTSHYYGADSFQFVASDGSTTSDPATARVDLTDKIGPFVSIGKGTLKMKRGKVAVKLGCPVGEQDGCPKGKLSITSSKRINITLHKRRKAKLLLGSARFSLKAGQSRKINVRLTRTARRVVKHLRDVRVNLTATVRDPNGNVGKTKQATHVRR